MRRVCLGVVAACAVAVLVPASPVLAEESCFGLPVTLSGTAGDDILVGTNDEDVISAGAGNDRVLGLGGEDHVCLGAGNDFVDGGPDNDALFAEPRPDGQDIFVGGPGHDIVDYSLRSTAVALSLNGEPDDGALGENDNIVPTNPTSPDGVELIVGSRADDRLIGGTGNDQLYGDDGNDHIEGGPGNDGLGGFEGNDVLLGGDGNDQIGGGEDADTMFGGPGDDLMTGGQGDDRFAADAEPDGRDTMFGFSGTDLITYINRTNGVTAIVNSAASEDFFTPDIENIFGSLGNDTIELTTRGPDLASNNVNGGPGDDTINLVDGTHGNDLIQGGAGIDRCRADRGDTIETCP